MKKVGIIGQGFVGSAIREGLKTYYQILTYDLDERKCNSNLSDIIKNCEIIFQCLPTPMFHDGQCDLSIVDESLSRVDKVSNTLGKNPIVVIKSTVPPGTTEQLNNRYENINVIFSPEF